EYTGNGEDGAEHGAVRPHRVDASRLAAPRFECRTAFDILPENRIAGRCGSIPAENSLIDFQRGRTRNRSLVLAREIQRHRSAGSDGSLFLTNPKIAVLVLQERADRNDGSGEAGAKNRLNCRRPRYPGEKI